MEAWREELYRDELYHHGILGMKWGVRRYQNPDGTLTAAGRRRLGLKERRERKYLEKAQKQREKELEKEMNRAEDNAADEFEKTENGRKLRKDLDRMYDEYFYNANVDSDTPEGRALSEAFEKAEDKFLRAQGRYICQSILSQYGEDGFRTFAQRFNMSELAKKKDADVLKIIEEYSKEYRERHGE